MNAIPNDAATVPPGGSPPRVLEPSDYGEFLLRSRGDILFVLKALVEHASQITVFFNEGRDLLLTTLAAITDQGLVFDFGASPEINRRALEAQKLFCITSP